MTNFNYKDCEVEITEKEDCFVIRLCNQFGFRWFQTKNKEEKYLRLLNAYKIEQEIINVPFGKYAFICPIII
jgi:hypothetical protein